MVCPGGFVKISVNLSFFNAYFFIILIALNLLMSFTCIFQLADSLQLFEVVKAFWLWCANNSDSIFLNSVVAQQLLKLPFPSLWILFMWMLPPLHLPLDFSNRSHLYRWILQQVIALKSSTGHQIALHSINNFWKSGINISILKNIPEGLKELLLFFQQ